MGNLLTLNEFIEGIKPANDVVFISPVNNLDVNKRLIGNDINTFLEYYENIKEDKEQLFKTFLSFSRVPVSSKDLWAIFNTNVFNDFKARWSYSFTVGEDLYAYFQLTELLKD